LISFAKSHGNISKDDRAGHVVFQEEMWNTFMELHQKSYKKKLFLRPRYKWGKIIKHLTTGQDVQCAELN